MSTTPNEKHALWISHLDAAKERELSLKAYAEQVGLKVDTLYSWRAQLKKKDQKPPSSIAFVKVQPKTPPVDKQHDLPEASNITVKLPNGITLLLRELNLQNLQVLSRL